MTDAIDMFGASAASNTDSSNGYVSSSIVEDVENKFPNKEEIAAIKVLWLAQRDRDIAELPEKTIEMMLDSPLICFKPAFNTLDNVIKNLQGLKERMNG